MAFEDVPRDLDAAREFDFLDGDGRAEHEGYGD